MPHLLSQVPIAPISDPGFTNIGGIGTPEDPIIPSDSVVLDPQEEHRPVADRLAIKAALLLEIRWLMEK